jgi:hypothetical protein
MPEINPFEDMDFTDEEHAQLAALLEEGEELEQELNFHPIVRNTIYLCLDEDGLNWRKELDDDRVEAIVNFLDAIRDDESMNIGKAVFDLGRFALYLDHEDGKAGKTPYQLVNVVNDAVIRFDLLSTVNIVETSNQRQHDKLMGKDGGLTAPKANEEKPEGALSLDDLASRRRI